MVLLKIICFLRDGEGNPLPNKKILFFHSYDGKNFSLFDEKITDENGACETSYEFNKYGTVWFKCVFEGDEVYDRCEAVATYTRQYTQILVNVIASLISTMITITVLLITLILIKKIMKKQ